MTHMPDIPVYRLFRHKAEDEYIGSHADMMGHLR
jgi:hypothetical protein